MIHMQSSDDLGSFAEQVGGSTPVRALEADPGVLGPLLKH